MLLVIFIAPFLIAIAVVSYIGHTNNLKVEAFFKNNQCNTIYNYQGRFKALCSDKILVINDYFIVDFLSNKQIYYKDIKKINLKNSSVSIQSKNRHLLVFKQNTDAKQFQKKLQRKINQFL